MPKQLTEELFQTYSDKSDSLKVEVLYNDTYDYFYFNFYENGELVLGDTTIVNDYENNYFKLSSLNADYATFADVKQFSLEFLDE